MTPHFTQMSPTAESDDHYEPAWREGAHVFCRGASRGDSTVWLPFISTFSFDYSFLPQPKAHVIDLF